MRFDLLIPKKISFGEGAFDRYLDGITISGNALIVTTASNMSVAKRITEAYRLRGYSVETVIVSGEPESEVVDSLVDAVKRPDIVIGLGGGSAIDIAKALSGLIPNGGNIKEYLEGVGTGRVMTVDPLPFVAIPTTAGTGAEATKNAVISSRVEGYKKSFRDDRLMADLVIVDPLLTVGVPDYVTARSGMDALTQLIEAYTSQKATYATRAIAMEGLRYVGALRRAYTDGTDISARRDMSYAALLSGIALANGGLGAAHGIAPSLSPYGLGHGEACARLLPYVVEYNSLEVTDDYRTIALTLGTDDLIGYLRDLVRDLGIPDLKELRLTREQWDGIIDSSNSSSMKGNPIPYDSDRLKAFFRARLGLE